VRHEDGQRRARLATALPQRWSVPRGPRVQPAAARLADPTEGLATAPPSTVGRMVLSRL